MDNVTHSLAGLLLAECAVRLRARGAGADPSPRFRTTAAIIGVVAANLPDADLLYTGVGGDRLAYMLHHRGYTHTVLLAVVGALLVWGVAWMVWRQRAPSSIPRHDSRWLLGLALAGTLSHLVLDWTNSYGVHPFWPLDDGWLYGDSVFIVEPWFWVVAVPPLVAASGRRATRWLLSIILLIGLALAWRVELVATGAAAALTLGAALTVVLARRLGPDGRFVAALTGWLMVEVVMAAGAGAVRAATRSAVRSAAPGAELLDVVVTPLPANPVCATVITVERSGDSYRVATARGSSLPWLVDASRCGGRGRGAGGGAGGGILADSERERTAGVAWDAEWSSPLADLATLARESCPALAALRFIRVPAWFPADDSTMVLGDLRFGAVSGSGFTDVRVPRRAATCRGSVPPWTPPRAGLLGPAIGPAVASGQRSPVT